MDIEKLRYPIGKFIEPPVITSGNIEEWIETIESLPSRLRKVVETLTDQQLDTPYREGGWTLRQVVHHLADSHMNAYIRFKLAITEDHPVIKPYEEGRWAELKEAKHSPVEISLDLLVALHRRWVVSLRNMQEADWERTYFHPESKRDWKLAGVLALYAWHSNHHLSHITSLCRRMNWNLETV